MKILLRTTGRGFLAGLVLMILFLEAGFAEPDRPFTYYEFDGLFVYYETGDVSAYRELLPPVFDMPDEPLVMIFVMDYYKMDKATQPYREAAAFLLAKYKQRTGWHCVVMPVTSDAARIGGIIYLGFPKIMGDVTLRRDPSSFTGILSLNDKTVMAVTIRPGDGVSPREEEWFEKFQGLPSFNLIDGKVYEPEFGGRENALTVSRLYPDKFVVRTGTANLIQDAKAAGESSERLAKIFSIRPSEIVLAYYLKNSFKMNFGVGTFADREDRR